MSSLYYGGNSMSSIDEYLDRVNKMHRAPSTTMIVGDYLEAPQHASSYPEKHRDKHHGHVKIFHHQHVPEGDKKVRFNESEERVEVDRRGHKQHQVVEERTIDVEADGFIQKRHKNFESCNTYNGY